MMELDVTALQLLSGEEPVGLDDCWWTCGWSGGSVCEITSPCGVTTIKPCLWTSS